MTRAPLTIDVVDPVLVAPLKRIPPLNLERPWLRRLAAAGARLVPGAKVAGVNRRIVRVGGIRLRVFVPDRASGAALLWIHGGGLVLGAASMDDRFCGETARDTGAVVVSVDYRLAPRHPFPVPLDDCRTGWAWLEEHAAELGVDLARVAVGGQSAGGGLAAALVQRLHDEGRAVAAQWLFCPMLDDRTAADRSLDDVSHFVWNNRANLVGWSSYLGGAPGAASVAPYASAARRDDVAGLPPTWIYWSAIELFADEDAAYAQRLADAVVPVETVVVRGAPHGFEAWARGTEPARALLRQARAWLAKTLG